LTTSIPSTPTTTSNTVAAPNLVHGESVTPTGGASEYVVVKNDNYTTIAKRNNVTVPALRAANPGIIETRLQVGQKLKIPAPTAATTPGTSMMANAASSMDSSIYVVKSGDNLIKIAGKYNTTPQALRSLNALKTDRIKVGDKLKLPAKATPAAGATTTESSPLTPAGPGSVVSNPSSSPIMTR
jgi:LysM repeat protein